MLCLDGFSGDLLPGRRLRCEDSAEVPLLSWAREVLALVNHDVEVEEDGDGNNVEVSEDKDGNDAESNVGLLIQFINDLGLPDQ